MLTAYELCDVLVPLMSQCPSGLCACAPLIGNVDWSKGTAYTNSSFSAS